MKLIVIGAEGKTAKAKRNAKVRSAKKTALTAEIGACAPRRAAAGNVCSLACVSA